MRAVSKSQVTTISAGEALTLLGRAAIAFAAIAALMVVFSPSVVRGQDAPQSSPPAVQPVMTTHTVLAGETLWSLAARYYGDGHKWRDLAKLNGLGENGERGLVVGQALKVPARKGADKGADVKVAKSDAPSTEPAAAKAPAAAPVRPPRTVVATTNKPSGTLASQTAGKGDAAAKAPTKAPAKGVTASTTPKAGATKPTDSKSTVALSDSARSTPQSRAPENATVIAAPATRVWSVDSREQDAARGKDSPTIFQGRASDVAAPSSSSGQSSTAATVSAAPRPRSGEFEAAPFAIAKDRESGAGVVGRRVGAAASGSATEVQRLLFTDDAEVQLPQGTSAQVGGRFVAVQLGPTLSGGARLAIPTGILQITRADAGKPVVARVTRQSGLIERGQLLFPVEGSPAAAGAHATPLPAGSGAPVTQVVWVDSTQLLPSLQSYLVLAASERDGVAAGDEFWLVARQGVGADAREQRIAVARVVRVTAFGSTAVVTRQDQAGIAVGVAARRVAKVN